MSTMPDSTFADPQQVIAELQMRLTEVISERDEAQERETATAEVLQVINSSPGDLKPVFDAMLERAMRLCDAAFGNILTYDGELLAPVSITGHSHFDEWIRARGAFRPEPGTTNARIIAGEEMIEVLDLVQDQATPSGNEVRRGLIKIGGFRTLLSIWLRKDDALLGVMHFYRQEVRGFSPKQISLLQNFAAQAVIAMENARLITETREALEQQKASARFSA